MSAAALKTSEILAGLAAGQHAGRITVREVVAALGERAYSLLIVVLALPNCLPMPPPIPLICGILLALVAVQIFTGRPQPWLPQRLLDRSLARKDVVRAATRAVPWLQRLEQVARPRFGVLASDQAMRLIGVALLAFSLALVFAAPIIGQIPLGLGIALVGLGLVERDGYVVIGGLVVGSIGTSLSLGFIVALVAGAEAMF
ncbi:MAG: exopolysaccharide biosynthesis protein [Burkholderiales bacterium]|nr:exopolysaccharide biosynthesis protein [Burkholderiales bacterium]